MTNNIYNAVVHNLDETGKLQSGIVFQEQYVINPSWIPGREKRFVDDDAARAYTEELNQNGKLKNARTESLPFLCISLVPIARVARGITALNARLFTFGKTNATAPVPAVANDVTPPPIMG
jgi:hypothetical protein